MKATIAAVATLGFALSTLLATATAASREREGDEAVTRARHAAREWLALVDKGKYEQSWDESASLFKQEITRSDWAAKVGGLRAPLGGLESRRLRTAAFSHHLIGVTGFPEGDYVVFRYDSRFANKTAAAELLRVMRDQDGRFRAAGYFIE